VLFFRTELAADVVSVVVIVKTDSEGVGAADRGARLVCRTSVALVEETVAAGVAPHRPFESFFGVVTERRRLRHLLRRSFGFLGERAPLIGEDCDSEWLFTVRRTAVAAVGALETDTLDNISDKFYVERLCAFYSQVRLLHVP